MTSSEVHQAMDWHGREFACSVVNEVASEA